jgi:glucosamine-6-phosphate deaminase
MHEQMLIDNLIVRIYPDRNELGKSAGQEIANKIRELQKSKELVNMIFGAAPSQNETLDQLVKETGIDWSRINAFHMDEYVGLDDDSPQKFAYYLKDRLFSKLNFKAVYYLNGNADDSQQECTRYEELLKKNPPDIVCMGIGENTHIAFNDPHVSDFNDPQLVKIVDLDLACRQQQVNDGCFENIGAVPTHAITLTVPALSQSKYAFCMVPGEKKARAVYLTLTETVSDKIPSTILRRHSNAILFLDPDSAGIFKAV